MKRIKLPPDLRRYSRICALKRIIPCLVLTILVLYFIVAHGDTFIAAVFGNVITDDANTGFKVAAYMALLVLPFVLTGVPHRLMDETYYGEVLSVMVKTTVTNKILVRRLYDINVVKLTVATQKGIREKVVYRGPVNSNYDLDRFKKGDFVFHLYGSKRTIRLENNASPICPVCTLTDNSGDGTCKYCGHSLVTYNLV